MKRAVLISGLAGIYCRFHHISKWIDSKLIYENPTDHRNPRQKKVNNLKKLSFNRKL